MKVQSGIELVNFMIEEIQNKKRLELVDELFSEQFINHSAPANLPNDRNGMRQLFAMTSKAFPDGHVVVEDQVASDTKVWTRKRFTGTHRETIAGFHPTGKVISYQVIDILGISDQQFIGHWGIVDRLALFQDLGTA